MVLDSPLGVCFFQVFFDKMKDAQQEIKSTVTVNTSDIAAKTHESKQDVKDLEKISRKHEGIHACLVTNFGLMYLLILNFSKVQWNNHNR